MPLSKVSYPYANNTFFLPTLASNATNGTSSFSGPTIFLGTASFQQEVSLSSSLSSLSITSTTGNFTNLFVSNQTSIGTVSQLAQLTVIPSVAGRRGITVRDLAGISTPNLFRVESSAGSNIFSVDTSSGIVMSTLLNLSNNQIVNAGTLYISAPSYYLQVGKYLPTIYVNTSNNWQSLLISSPASGTPRVDPITIITSGTNVPLLEINGSGEIFARNSGRTPLIVRGMRSDIGYQATVNSISGNGSSVTYDTGLTSGNPFVVGSVVTITGASTAGYNGTFTVTTANQNSFVVSNTTTGASSSATATSVGHTADLVQYLNPAGTIFGGRNSIGQIYTGSTTTINTQVGGAVTGSSHNGTTATINLTSAPNLAVGDQIVVSGFSPAGWNGTHIVTAVSNTPTFSVSYANPNPGTAAANGIVSAPAQNSVIARSAGTVGQVIRAAASQSADLMQFRDSSNNIISSFTNLGALLLPAATTSTPSLRAPHGTAPSAPTNGDIWTTTTGLFVRVNGATVGPLAAGFSNPMTTLGDTIYGAASGTPTRLAGNTTTTRNFLGQTGDGTNSAAPSWTASTGTGSVVLATTPSISGATFTAQLQSTLANNATTGSGQIYLNGATGNRIDWNNNGTAAPAFTTRSAGTKLTLFSAVDATNVDYAIGIEPSNTWFSIPQATASFGYKWYAGTTTVASLTGAGTLTIGSLATTGTVNINIAGTGTLNIGDGTVSKSSGSGFSFNSSGSFTQGITSTGGALALNYASPAITSNNASAASIFTSTVTGITIGSSTIKTTKYPAAPSGTTTGTVTQAAQLSGYLGMPVNQQGVAATALSYTLVASDAGKMIYVQSTPTTPTITIPANSAVAFEIGTTIVVMNDIGAATNVSIAINTDTLQLVSTGLTGTRTLARYGMATLVKVTATKWIITGNGVT